MRPERALKLINQCGRENLPLEAEVERHARVRAMPTSVVSELNTVAAVPTVAVPSVAVTVPVTIPIPVAVTMAITRTMPVPIPVVTVPIPAAVPVADTRWVAIDRIATVLTIPG